jgi:hypothetical protein
LPNVKKAPAKGPNGEIELLLNDSEEQEDLYNPFRNPKKKKKNKGKGNKKGKKFKRKKILLDGPGEQ